MAIRLKDIARDLGVSTVTVSKVLRGNRDISDETRQRVLKRMKELNYQPNMMARGLASGHTYTVGLVVPDLVHPFFAEFAKSLSGVLRSGNRALILASSEEDPEIEEQEIQDIAQSRDRRAAHRLLPDKAEEFLSTRRRTNSLSAVRSELPLSRRPLCRLR